jgi:hypothetical protein
MHANVKKKLRNNKFLFILNSKIKAFLQYLFDYWFKRLYACDLDKLELPEKGGNFQSTNACISKKKRALWVGSDENQDESGIHQALEAIYDVEYFYSENGSYGLWNPKDPILYENARKVNHERLIKYVDKFDIVIGQFWGHILDKETLALFQVNSKVINISMDDVLYNVWKTGKGSNSLRNVCDIILSTYPPAVSFYRSKGLSSYLIPLGSDPAIFGESVFERDIDVLFVGNNYGKRGNIIKFLKNNGIKVDAYGKGFEKGFLPFEEASRLAARAKIILGIGYVGYSEKVSTLKLRDFDSVMSGALYLTNFNYVYDYFFNSCKPVCYETNAELLEKIIYYLKHDKERELISRQMNQLCRDKYKWIDLFKRIDGLLED